MRNYEMPDGSWDGVREQADYEQAEMEQAGRDVARAYRRVLAAILNGDLGKAARECPHGWGKGNLCFHCGADIVAKPPVALAIGPAMCPRCDKDLAISGRGAICENGHDWHLKEDLTARTLESGRTVATLNANGTFSTTGGR